MFRWLLIGLCVCARARVRVSLRVCLCARVSVFVVVFVVVFVFDLCEGARAFAVRVLVIVRFRPLTIDQDDARDGTACRLGQRSK